MWSFSDKHLGGEVVGFYDGKLAIIQNNIDARACIFLDVDINREKIRSVGHHMVIYNKRLSHVNINYSNCIQPNVNRNFDGKNDFQKKYPFGTIHLMLGIFQEANLLNNLSKDAIWPLLFTDGVWNNLFGYTENCIEWINYLSINNKNQILNSLLCANHYSFYEIMLGLNDFLRMRDNFNATGYCNGSGLYIEGGRNKRTGDKLRISNSSGIPINLVNNISTVDIHNKEKIRIEEFVISMAKYVGWSYQVEKWHWNNFRLYKFSKGDFSKTSLNNQTYSSLMDTNPLSMAMTSGTNIEYTIETNDKLF